MGPAALRSRASRILATSSICNAPLPTCKKCADQIAHHVVQEPVTAHGVSQFLVGPHPLGGMDGADVRNALLVAFLLAFSDASAAVRIGRGERREVMRADDVLGGADQRFFVHRVGIVIDVAGQKRRTNSTAIDSVAIGFR